MKTDMMKSLTLLDDLEQIPTTDDRIYRSFDEIKQHLLQMDKDFNSIEVAAGVEGALVGLFPNQSEIADDLHEAYQLAFANSDQSLAEHYEDVVGRGEASAVGFVSNLKGKLAELRIRDQLDEQFPDYTFSIAADPNQPVWDIRGVADNGGEDILIQCKVGGIEYAPEVMDRMEENPGLLFAASAEIQDAILTKHPELAEQFIEIDISSFQLTSEIEEDLDLLGDIFDVVVPGSIRDVLPYVSEVVLGIRLILDVVAVERDFAAVDMKDRQNIHGLKVLILFSRFGVSAVCTTAGGAMGTLITPVVGTALGSLGGAVLSTYINKKVKPHTMELAMKFMGVTDDDMFYFRNKESIDAVGLSLSNMQG